MHSHPALWPCAHSFYSMSPVHTHLLCGPCEHSHYSMSPVHTYPALWALCTLMCTHSSCSVGPVHTHPSLWDLCTLTSVSSVQLTCVHSSSWWALSTLTFWEPFPHSPSLGVLCTLTFSVGPVHTHPALFYSKRKLYKGEKFTSQEELAFKLPIHWSGEEGKIQGLGMSIKY